MTHSWTIRQKEVILKIAEELGSDVKSYRDFDVPRSTIYGWKKI